MAETLKLESLCEKIVDCEHKTAPAAPPGQEYGYAVGTPHIRAGRILLGNAKPVDRATYELWTAREAPQAGDLILAREAPVGEVGRILPGQRICLGQRTVLLRPNADRADPTYLHYLLLSPQVQDEMLSKASGSTVSHLNVKDIRLLPVPTLPTLEDQRQIGGLLEALDDKIAVNDRIASTADTLRSSLLQDAQEQRRDDFLAQPLSQVAEFINGRAFTKGATGNGRMVVRIAEINSGPGPSTVYNDIAVDEKHLAHPGDILFSWSGSLAVTRWFRPEAIINQHIFKVIPRGHNPKWLAFEAVKSKLADYRAIAADKATTMGHIQRRHLDEEVVVPIPEVIDRLDRQAGNLWQRALVAEQESLTLAALRDSLLPELMSGRLRVRDAEKVIEEAV
ncbi:restriction endonuclease subunit S [Micromonospora sediminicola]|uniref:restriction endonuclease subunit S n=1 Tax=Micromonospora sediminicola TaxID=946078 RepID=UPI0034093B98